MKHVFISVLIFIVSLKFMWMLNVCTANEQASKCLIVRLINVHFTISYVIQPKYIHLY